MEQYLIIDFKNKTITCASDIEIKYNDIDSGGSEKCLGNKDLAESATEILENNLKMLLTGNYF